ncbi:MAG: hypothetical protein LBJ92_03790 [Holosporales bacterium]|nr:hypothetical protein [Holosporales bacterium]
MKFKHSTSYRKPLESELLEGKTVHRPAVYLSVYHPCFSGLHHKFN